MLFFPLFNELAIKWMFVATLTSLPDATRPAFIAQVTDVFERRIVNPY
jgi:hypothetical protein